MGWVAWARGRGEAAAAARLPWRRVSLIHVLAVAGCAIRSPQELLQDVVPALESVLTWLLPLGFAAVLLCSTTVRDKLLTAQQ